MSVSKSEIRETYYPIFVLVYVFLLFHYELLFLFIKLVSTEYLKVVVIWSYLLIFITE